MFVESSESYHGHSDPSGTYSHGGICFQVHFCVSTSVSALHGLESSDDSQGVEEHHDDPVHVCDLDVPDYDGYPESPPSGAKDNKVKKKG